MRGYGGGERSNLGGRNSAFGGYQAGGFAQASSNRGRASFGENRGFGGGGGRGFGGGGGRRR
jgi:histone deacetylase complex subunit SAP18